jgi:high-affinity Fe2+/Pb2+ permease
LVKQENILAGLASTVMAIAMIAAFLLIVGGIRLLLRKEERGRGALMIGAAAVLIGNVLIWTV